MIARHPTAANKKGKLEGVPVDSLRLRGKRISWCCCDGGYCQPG
jgi:hypothetical protein